MEAIIFAYSTNPEVSTSYKERKIDSQNRRNFNGKLGDIGREVRFSFRQLTTNKMLNQLRENRA